MRLPRWFVCVVPLLLTGCQRDMIYFPTTASEAALLAAAREQGLVPWRDDAGTLIGWRTPAEAGAPRPVALVFHGNAGHALMRTYYVAGFSGTQRPPGWDVVLFEYPGYGARPGSPSEDTVLAAADHAFQQLQREGERPVYLVGESLGSGVASHLAGLHPEKVAGVLLVTPFNSLRDVAKQHYPAFLVRLLLREHYDNEAALAHYRGPLAVLLAEDDEVVPAKLGQQLFDGYVGPKRRWVQPGRTHNTVDFSPDAAWWGEAAAFLQHQR